MTWNTHKSPLVKTIQTDYQRYGACAVLSLETAKNMMIENGYDQYLNEKDSDFTAVIYLKVCLSVRKKILSAITLLRPGRVTHTYSKVN